MTTPTPTDPRFEAVPIALVWDDDRLVVTATAPQLRRAVGAAMEEWYAMQQDPGWGSMDFPSSVIDALVQMGCGQEGVWDPRGGGA